MSTRVYTRRFDWDEAARLHQEGVSYAEIARRLGVSPNAIRFACHPDEYQRAKERNAAYMKTGVCPQCGGPASRNYTDGQNRCRTCWQQTLPTTVRDNELRCHSCHQWKPDSAYPMNRTLEYRRGRHGTCTQCQTKDKRAWRERNHDHENEYQRQYQYKRRRRAA